MIVPVRLDLIIFKDLPWDMDFDWTVGGVPFDFTLHTATLTLVNADTHASTDVATTANGRIILSTGHVQVVLPYTATNLALGLYEWYLKAFDSALVPLMVGSGRCSVRLGFE